MSKQTQSARIFLKYVWRGARQVSRQAGRSHRLPPARPEGCVRAILTPIKGDPDRHTLPHHGKQVAFALLGLVVVMLNDIRPVLFLHILDRRQHKRPSRRSTVPDFAEAGFAGARGRLSSDSCPREKNTHQEVSPIETRVWCTRCAKVPEGTLFGRRFV